MPPIVTSFNGRTRTASVAADAIGGSRVIRRSGARPATGLSTPRRPARQPVRRLQAAAPAADDDANACRSRPRSSLKNLMALHVSLMSNYIIAGGSVEVMFRDSVSGPAAGAWLPDLLDQTWRGAAAALYALVARLRRRSRPIRVRNVSEEWLTGHAVESEKHLDGI